MEKDRVRQKVFGVSTNPDTDALVRREAKRLGMSISSLICMCVHEWVERRGRGGA